MMKHVQMLWLCVLIAGVISCAKTENQVAIESTPHLIDSLATLETVSLYKNLKKLVGVGLLFGHQETTAYGVGWTAEEARSDVKLVTGDFPAVYGWDIGREDQTRNVDGVPFTRVRQLIIEAYQRGGINTISWHVDNPTSLGSSWDTTRTVTHILPGGKDHEKFVQRLEYVADFLASCKVDDVYIPIIFRPFHEHNGTWFWWGKGLCTEQEYIALWKFTVDYLKNIKQFHHLIYAFSPDRSRMTFTKESYLYGYPGDDYVDIIGYDNYMDVGISWNKKSTRDQQKDFVSGLRLISSIANDKNKIAALTETGLETISNENWFTETLLNPIKGDTSIQVSFVVLWRNATEKHHYAPYPSHSSVSDFLLFYNDPFSLFGNDIQNLYRENKPLHKEK